MLGGGSAKRLPQSLRRPTTDATVPGTKQSTGSAVHTAASARRPSRKITPKCGALFGNQAFLDRARPQNVRVRWKLAEKLAELIKSTSANGSKVLREAQQSKAD